MRYCKKNDFQYSALTMETINERVKFFKNALFDQKIGAVARSSKFVVESVLKHVRKPLNLVIEHGAGDGAMTRALLTQLAPNGKLYAIESNHEFAKDLHMINDDRLNVYIGNAQEFHAENPLQIYGADLIVSSIPFSFLRSQEREELIKYAYDSLLPEGIFIIFHQYSWLMFAPLKKIFPMVNISFEPRNLFPCFILEARK